MYYYWRPLLFGPQFIIMAVFTPHSRLQIKLKSWENFILFIILLFIIRSRRPLILSSFTLRASFAQSFPLDLLLLSSSITHLALIIYYNINNFYNSIFRNFFRVHTMTDAGEHHSTRTCLKVRCLNILQRSLIFCRMCCDWLLLYSLVGICYQFGVVG
jgi:hypothetical protein